MSGDACLGQRIHVHQQILRDDKRVLFVCLGLPQLNLYEVGDEQRIDYDSRVSPCKKKRKQIHVVASGRLHADQKTLLGRR